jgi:hypothetical protein
MRKNPWTSFSIVNSHGIFNHNNGRRLVGEFFSPILEMTRKSYRLTRRTCQRSSKLSEVYASLKKQTHVTNGKS